uniref:Cilia- and flagella-associated protein 54 n=1 Tax=Knipowitschia caucasica TaxID=637954 RepID=A0AAV2JA03_KNICA
MDLLPASYYGKLDQRNPVIIAFLKEINSFIAVMRKISSSPTRQNNNDFVKGNKILGEVWKKYKSRLPHWFYEEHILQVADVLLELKFSDMALWYGYKPHLQQYTSLDIVDIEDIDHFKALFCPKGLDTDQDSLLMMIRALNGCAMCTFEQVKAHRILSADNLYKLLSVLDTLQIIMQVFQHHNSLCWQIHNASVLIYNICRYLMTQNYSAQVLEYLLWASFAIELSVPLMTSKKVSWLVTLYCAVCQCYYDSDAAVQGEIFARRALVKIYELKNIEEQCEFPVSNENRRSYKEASIKLATMIFKRAVFEAGKTNQFKTKRNVSDMLKAPWPRNPTEQILSSLFEGGAAQFLGVLEALRDSSRLVSSTGASEVVQELLAAGISLLSKSDEENEGQSPASLRAVTSSCSLLELSVAGENKISFEAAVEFIKLLYHNKQPDAFSEHSREMLQLLSCFKGQASDKAELELSLLYYYSCVQKEKQKTVLSVSDELNKLMKTLHKYVHNTDSELDSDLVMSVILFVWEKVMSVIERRPRHLIDFKKFDEWEWCLAVLCDVAFAFEPCTSHYCIMTGEMTLTLCLLLESASKHTRQKTLSCVNFTEGDVGIESSFTLSQKYGMLSPSSLSEERRNQDIFPDVLAFNNTWNRDDFLLVVDLHLYLNAIYYKSFLSLMEENAAAESEILHQIKKNKILKAVYLMQKALREYKMDPVSTNIKNHLEVSTELIRRAGFEERKLYTSTGTLSQCASSKDRDEKDCPPPPPVLTARSDCSFSFVPAPYHPKQKVCWYQLLGHVSEGPTSSNVRLGDVNLVGTGRLIPAESGRCVLKVEGLDPNQKYVFAVAAYNSQGGLVSNSIGETTIPLLASPPLPLLTSWAYLAQVAFKTKQYDAAKRACQILWSHFINSESRANNMHHRAMFIWEQIDRLENCEQMLLAIDLMPWLIEQSDALQAVVVCYALVNPLIYHQISCQPLIQVLTKCLEVLEENLPQLKHKWTGRASEPLMHRIACITYYLYKTFHNLNEDTKAAQLMDCGVNLLQEIYDAQSKRIKTTVVMVKKANSTLKSEKKVNPQLKALLVTINENANTISFHEDHGKIYDFLSSTSIKRAFQEVMKLEQRTLFIESSTLLLQRALEEGETALVIEWGENFAELISKKWTQNNMKHFKKQMMFGNMFCEESVWRTNLNYIVAQAHLALFYESLKQLQEEPPLHRYSQLDPVDFSLANSSVPLRIRRNIQQQSLSERDRTIKADAEARKCDPSYKEEEESSAHEIQRQTAAFILESLTNAVLHLRRAMVLAHRSSHLALQFNAYTRDYYALIVSPLLINAQRRLLERIETFKGPLVPQPHHVKTKEVTGQEVTYKSYAGVQLLCSWIPTQKVVTAKRKALSRIQLIAAEVQRSMALVCVPLDVEDTLYWYRKAVEKTSPCLQFLQHSRLQLRCLLANTQSDYGALVPCKEAKKLTTTFDFSPVVKLAPSAKPCDLIEKDYMTKESVYTLPLSPEHVPSITAAYTSAIKYFHENKHDSLSIVALHDLGNLHFFNGNTKAAHLCWTKAINTALKSPNAMEQWNGMTFGGCSLENRLKLSGIWGCLQAAILNAKIAQYILTTDICNRTNSCLQAAHLFKCVLCCSLAQPQCDLHYASDRIIEELLPGVDFFSDPSRLHLGTTIASLSFVCQWLFSSGHYMKLLPMLALYLYFVGSVCRDVQRTIDCKILKIRALTELGFFTEAVNEFLLLRKGAGFSFGHCIKRDEDQVETTFSHNPNVLENLEMLEDLVNCDFTSAVCALYGSALCLRFKLAQAQLILAISATIFSPLEVPDRENETISIENEEEEDTKLLDLQSAGKPLPLGKLKYLLLEAASSLLKNFAKQLTTYSHVDKVEMSVEFNLLKAKLFCLKGQATLCTEAALSSMMILRSASDNRKAPTSEFEMQSLLKQNGSEPGTLQSIKPPSVDGDSVELIETSERIGCHMWIRCRLTLVHSLTAHDLNTGRGNKLKRETARMIRDGIEECKKWGDPDSQALLMLECAQWGTTTVNESNQIKEIVGLLSGRVNMPPRSAITLAQASILLHEMKAPESVAFLKLSQKLLQTQLNSFNQNIHFDDGGSCVQCCSNFCLPLIHLLHHTTSCIDDMN